MRFGLDDLAVQRLQSVFRRHPEIEAVKVFGSRALGFEKPNSDIDLVLWGAVDDRLLGRICGELEDLPLPYLFDVQVVSQVRHPGLRRHIEEHAVDLYETGAAGR